jgi:hypothetical protein
MGGHAVKVEDLVRAHAQGLAHVGIHPAERLSQESPQRAVQSAAPAQHAEDDLVQEREVARVERALVDRLEQARRPGILLGNAHEDLDRPRADARRAPRADLLSGAAGSLRRGEL